MGEFADMEFDRLMADMDQRDDGWDWDDGRLEFGAAPIPRCRRCNAALTFELNRSAKWVPRNNDGSQHRCDATATNEDFPPL